MDLKELTDHLNIAELLTDEALREIGDTLGRQVEADLQSRSTWMEDMEKWLMLAEQITEPKNDPWPNAANIKYPLLNTAAIQFHARSYPTLFGTRDLVNAHILGVTDDFKRARANRVSRFMSLQLSVLMDDWLEEMDRLLFLLPIIGLVYKKTYYSMIKNVVESTLCTPKEVIVNYHATDYERARVTHHMYMDKNEIIEYQRSQLYLDCDLDDNTSPAIGGTRDRTQGLSLSSDNDGNTVEVYESHCWYDLDEDGYREPYIITFLKSNSKVLRIVARWDITGLEYDPSGSVKRIAAINYWTPYKFLPDPDSKVYGIGFGRLLGPTNKAVNTLINQLLDSGTLNNLQSGFLARGFRRQGGKIKFSPGHWEVVPTAAQDIRNGIMPLPTKEPSNVLFSMLNLLISSGRDLASIQDPMLGKNPGQNQPFSTTQEVITQGEKVFNGIYKRVYRSLTSELKKIYLLNYQYLDNISYVNVIDDVNGDVEMDFGIEDLDVLPAAEPDMVLESKKIERANNLLLKAANGLPVNVQVATMRMLEAEGHDNIEELMAMPEPPPDIEMLKLQLDADKFQWQQQMDRMDIELLDIKTKEQALRDRLSGFAKLADVELKAKQLEVDATEIALNEIAKQREEVIHMYELSTRAVSERMKMKNANTK